MKLQLDKFPSYIEYNFGKLPTTYIKCVADDLFIEVDNQSKSIRQITSKRAIIEILEDDRTEFKEIRGERFNEFFNHVMDYLKAQ